MTIQKIHYSHPNEARWRRGGYLIIHGAHTAVCTGGTTAWCLTYTRSNVTCKKCLAIIPL